LAPAGVRLSVLRIQTNGLGVCSYRSIKMAFLSQQIALLRCFIFWATHDEFSFSGLEQAPISIPISNPVDFAGGNGARAVVSHDGAGGQHQSGAGRLSFRYQESAESLRQEAILDQ
jgi:hypothetical protein